MRSLINEQIGLSFSKKKNVTKYVIYWVLYSILVSEYANARSSSPAFASFPFTSIGYPVITLAQDAARKNNRPLLLYYLHL